MCTVMRSILAVCLVTGRRLSFLRHVSKAVRGAQFTAIRLGLLLLMLMGWLLPVNPALAQPAAHVIDLNAASPETLGSLPGIGPVLLQRILAARQQGSFTSPEEMVARVPGLGPGRLARWQAAGIVVQAEGRQQTPGASATATHSALARSARPSQGQISQPGTAVILTRPAGPPAGGRARVQPPQLVGRGQIDTATSSRPPRRRGMGSPAAPVRRSQSARSVRHNTLARTSRCWPARRHPGPATHTHTLFDDPPLFECASLFDRRSRLQASD
ncbi:MAG: helix-hairpin-helix domain-containing protein [Lautropia sp.]|nr:helix-hairpin-helix domain-containing protein [Lautropia sp.]